MPTQPVSGLLPTSRSADVQNVLDTLAEGVEETVRFGTHVLMWHSEASAGKQDEVMPVVMIFRHMLEMLDSVSILIRASSIEPAKLPLRTAFEAAAQVEWLIQTDTDRRGMAFMVWHAHHRLGLYRRFDRTTQQGKELASKLSGTVYDNIDATERFDLTAARANLESLLSNPRYVEAAREYERLKRKMRRGPQWFQLFGGPDSIEQLAARVSMADWYQILYRDWSGVVHATDVITGKVSSRNQSTEIRQLRWAGGAGAVYNFAVSLALSTFRHLTAATMPQRSDLVRKWYIDEVRPLYHSVSGEPDVWRD